MILKYLSYIIRHKWFVFVAGRKLRVPLWQLIVHDFSKFRPDEFFPYARYFYGTKLPSVYDVFGDERNHTPIFQEDIEEAFDIAWLKHIHRNPHHHQHWILREDDGGTKALEMPYHFVKEMVADWIGAGRAMGKNDVLPWYDANKDKMMLHPSTRHQVEHLLELLTTDPCLMEQDK